MADTRPTLSTILSNDLLHSIAPYLHPRDISALSLTNLRIYTQLSTTPSVHRHTDLTERKPNSKQDGSDALYFLRCKRLLSATRTLVLDGTLVALVQIEVILASSPITILSLLGCKNVNELELIEYLTDPDTPKPKGLYWFTRPADAASAPTATTDSRLRHTRLKEWAAVIAATPPNVCFDTRICHGRRHDGNDEVRVASVAMRGRCAGCHAEPDRPAGLEPVLVAPAPLHSSTLRAACVAPDGKPMPDCLRCEDCARNRHCEGCGKWWCESCAVDKNHVKRSCFECGFQCTECATAVSRTCESCRSGYCINHNEGADHTWCEWCHVFNKRRPSTTATATTITTSISTTTTTTTTASNAFLTSAASTYYAHLQRTQPGNTFVKHPAGGVGGGVGRMRGLGASGGAAIAGRHFQNEAIVRRRGLLNN